MSEKSPTKCSDCKRVFGSGYQDELVDRTVKKCDEFPWCWDCDDKHTEQEIRNQTLAEVLKIAIRNKEEVKGTADDYWFIRKIDKLAGSKLVEVKE